MILTMSPFGQLLLLGSSDTVYIMFFWHSLYYVFLTQSILCFSKWHVSSQLIVWWGYDGRKYTHMAPWNITFGQYNHRWRNISTIPLDTMWTSDYLQSGLGGCRDYITIVFLEKEIVNVVLGSKCPLSNDCINLHRNSLKCFCLYTCEIF